MEQGGLRQRLTAILAADVTAVGHWGTGDVEVRLSDPSQLDAVMALVRQAFEQQSEDGYEEPQWSRALSRKHRA